MGVFWTLATRNTFRNKRRTLLSVLVISIGLAALMLMDGWMVGLERQMTANATETFLGHGQIQPRKLVEDLDTSQVIDESEKILEDIRKQPQVLKAVPRIIGGGMVSSSQDVAAANLFGIDIDHERDFSKVNKSLVQGTFLTQNGQILLGEKMAKTLQLNLGDRVVATVADIKTSELSQQLFRLTGIFRMGNREMDQGFAFISYSDAERLFVTTKRASEIAIQFTDIVNSTKYTEELSKSLKQSGFTTEPLAIRSWEDILPQIKSIFELSGYMRYVTVAILFVLVFFSVMNSLLMSLHERQYELGVMKALGTRPEEMFRMILAECVVLAGVSILLGLLLGTLVNGYLVVWGANFSGSEFSGVSFTDPVKSAFTWTQFTEQPAWILLMTICSGLYPAYSASQISPNEALRKSL